MAGSRKDDADNDPTLEQEFFIGGWDPYVVELTRLKRKKSGGSGQSARQDRRVTKDRRKR